MVQSAAELCHLTIKLTQNFLFDLMLLINLSTVMSTAAMLFICVDLKSAAADCIVNLFPFSRAVIIALHGLMCSLDAFSSLICHKICCSPS